MDYSDLINHHRQSNADVTIATTPADEDHATHLGILQVRVQDPFMYSTGWEVEGNSGSHVVLPQSSAGHTLPGLLVYCPYMLLLLGVGHLHVFSALAVSLHNTCCCGVLLQVDGDLNVVGFEEKPQRSTLATMSIDTAQWGEFVAMGVCCESVYKMGSPSYVGNPTLGLNQRGKQSYVGAWEAKFSVGSQKFLALFSHGIPKIPDHGKHVLAYLLLIRSHAPFPSLNTA